ncbi:hypothetical protein CC80DRAFT_361645, partial [Byssothecium circinans]
VPSLLGKDLPPCGPEVQIAYENVNNMIRERWLSQLGKEPLNKSCIYVRRQLFTQQLVSPPFNRPDQRHRVPWRREIVFLYELRWIAYFVRESE